MDKVTDMAVTGLLVLVLAGPPILNCALGAEQDRSPDRGMPTLERVPEADLAKVQQDVRQALGRARADLDTQLAASDTPREVLAEVFGGTGLMYQAHLVLDAAAACYRNAATLQPGDYRWPYYLASVHRQAGRLEQAAGAYEAALRLNPALSVASLRLGQTYLEMGELDRAERRLQAASATMPLRAAALFELGKLALARRDPAAARDLLLKALQADSAATRVHYSLGLAYRDLGDADQARRHMELRGDGEPAVPDPLLNLLAGLSSGQRMLFHSGMRAAHLRDYAAAARSFADGLEVEPGNLDARVSLARFLFLDGDPVGAGNQLRAVLAKSPAKPLARFLLAVLDEAEGREAAALAGYQGVLDADPAHPGAHFQLAGYRWRAGDYAAAAAHYGAVLERSPENAAARFWQIQAGIQAGWPQRRLRVLLDAARERDPDDPATGYFLAALLAASADGGVRDGAGALILANRLQAEFPSPEHLELQAMALAETGDFPTAVARQQEALAVAYGQFRFDLVPGLNANLHRFQASEPCREPWSLEALRHASPPQNPRKFFAASPPETAF